jgi:ATP-dependent DNA helicase RecG
MPISDPMDQPVTTLKGVGPKVAEKLARLELRTLQDVLFHLPLRYQDRTRVCPIGALREGMEIVIEGQVEHTEIVFRRRRMLLCRVADGSGAILLRFFYFNKQQSESLRAGVGLRCFGEVRRGPQTLEMVHPEYRLQLGDKIVDVEETLTPIYPTTEGVHQLTLRRLTDEALLQVAGVHELLPMDCAGDPNFPALADALRFLHRPPPDANVALLQEGMHPAQQRLAFEELLAHQLSMLTLRARAAAYSAFPLDISGSLRERFLTNLPFKLTAAQQRVNTDIQQDLLQPHPMMRLVQGDVGSGKTVVAAMACLQAIEAGFQAVVMAPTEILTEQHYQSFRHWLEPLNIDIAWLSGKQKAAQRREMLALIKSGQAGVIVGTHALFQGDVEFAHLALIVVDEQHRFGVHQRMALREKGEREGRYPHQLIMTATPIPRTLAQTAYADLDVSVIDELPPGRKPIDTVAMSQARRAKVVEHVAAACRAGQQCYWVCTLVEESEALQCEAAEVTYAKLQEALADLHIGLVHGRLKPAEKEVVMQAFKAGELDLLVATTVIEVGVDVPNASLMIIDNAERLGLSQLHQLRGRVGRGSEKSSCVLLYQAPLSENGRKRIKALRETNDGFKIAQIDLELRGPGELLGTRQTGLMQFRIADLARDKALISQVTAVAIKLMAESPGWVEPLIRRWIGGKSRYREV